MRRSGETEENYVKRKNACHVRRNYHPQLLDQMSAEGEVAKCRSINASLVIENKRLGRLLKEARAIIDELQSFPAEIAEKAGSAGGSDTTASSQCHGHS